jgi:hypothetical protein
MDNAETWYISGSAIKINSAASSRAVALKKQSARVIEVTEGDQKYYLYASRTTSGSATGRVASPGGAAAGGVAVVITNQNNSANKTTATTGVDGTFTAQGIIPGDEYTVKVNNSTALVRPNTDGDDIGTITVSQGVNFKTTIAPVNGSLDMNELYGGTSYSFYLTVKNTGTENCLAATYKLEGDAGLSLSSPTGLENVLGSVVPGGQRTVGVAVSCAASAIPSDRVFKKISITITDTINHRTYTDSVSLKFHKNSTPFNIRAEHPISGILIAPGGKTYSFRNTMNSTITVPWLVDDYLLVFSGATVDTETRYSFAVGASPDTNYSQFLDLGNYEPNNTETTAPRVSGKEKVMSYLHMEDIDYYRINLTDVELDTPSDPEQPSSPEFVPVADITGIPAGVVMGVPLTLFPVVEPDNATCTTVELTVSGAGAKIEGGVFTAEAEGMAVITARVPGGLGRGQDFVKSFTIIVQNLHPGG